MSDKSQFNHGLTKSNNNCILLGSLSSSSKHRTDTCHVHAAYDTVYHLISYIYHVIPYYLWKNLLLIQKSFHIMKTKSMRHSQWIYYIGIYITTKFYIHRICFPEIFSHWHSYTADTVPIPDFQFFFNVYKCEEITCKDTK